MSKTIKEIAEECGVSEQAIRAWCRRNYVAKDAKGSFVLNDTLKEDIYAHYHVIQNNINRNENDVAKDAKASCETSETVLIAMLQKELDLKNGQLAAKDHQIEELNARLAESTEALLVAQQTVQAAQALHAGTIQKQLQSTNDLSSESDGIKKKNWMQRIFRR